VDEATIARHLPLADMTIYINFDLHVCGPDPRRKQNYVMLYQLRVLYCHVILGTD